MILFCGCLFTNALYHENYESVFKVSRNIRDLEKPAQTIILQALGAYFIIKCVKWLKSIDD